MWSFAEEIFHPQESRGEFIMQFPLLLDIEVTLQKRLNSIEYDPGIITLHKFIAGVANIDELSIKELREENTINPLPHPF